MRTRTINVYAFAELSEAAKERAREWWRSCAFDYEWWDGVYDLAREIGSALGFSLRDLSFDLLRGVSFRGTWYAPARPVRGVRKITTDEDVIALAHEIAELVCRMTPDERDDGYSIWDTRWYSVTCDEHEDVDEIAKAFAAIVYGWLQREEEYLLSDEAVDEALVANEYEFEEDGSRA